MDNDILIKLNDLLSDDKIFEDLEKYASKVNIYDILGISHRELQHSNILAWLLNPLENHNLSTRFLKVFMSIISENSKQNDDLEYELIDKEIFNNLNQKDIEVRREYKNIDLLVLDEKQKWVLLIENKIHSKEHSNQLKTYYDIVYTEYPDFKKMFVFLSINDSASSEQYINLHYFEIITILESILSKNEIEKEVEILLKEYVDTLRRITMDNNEVSKLCFEIYKKHKKAIDLLIENISDTTYFLNQAEEYFKEKEKEGIITVIPHETPKFKVFLSPNCLLDKFLSNYPIDWLFYNEANNLKIEEGKTSMLYFEVKPYKNDIRFYLWLFAPSQYKESNEDDDIKNKINSFLLDSKKEVLKGKKGNRKGAPLWIALYDVPIVDEKIIMREDFDRDTVVKNFFDNFFRGDFIKIEETLAKLQNELK